MQALIITGCVILFILLVLLLRVGCRFEYSADGTFLWLKVACFRFVLLPSKPLTPRQEAKKQAKQQEKRRKKMAEKAAKKKAKEEAIARGERPKKQSPAELVWLLQFVRPVFTALNSLRRKLRIESIQLEYAIGGADDPAQAALRYGQVSAGGGALFPLVNAVFDVKEWDVDLYVDFNQAKTKVALCATATYRVGQLLGIAIILGIKALSIYLKHKKQVTSEEEKKDGTKASNR